MRGHLRYVAISAMTALGVIVMSSEPGHAQAGKKRVGAVLSGYQEDPVVSTTGHGWFSGVIDETAGRIEYELFYDDLEGTPALFSHIHFGSRDHNGGVAAFLCGGGGKPACTNTTGFITGIITAADVVGPNGQGIEAGAFGELVQAIREGHTYVNVHTGRWPAGEIRGQINDANQRD